VSFHPLVWNWFSSRFAAPSPPQEAGWGPIARGCDTLIAAPTGSGKTLAAFLWSLDTLVRRGLEGNLEDRVHVVYVSPLKALGSDIQKNLREPLQGILDQAAREGLSLPEIRVAVRSGDTSARERHLQVRRPPHILITTPESLYILLTARRSRQILARAEVVIVDEIHALAADKRGAHLALSLERLDHLAGRRLQRIGLSATQRPIERVARLLTGHKEDCAIVDLGHRRDLDLSIQVPEQELGPIATHELWAEIYERICQEVRRHRTTLVFVHTRRLVERVAHQLSRRLGAGRVAAHHGSLSREHRLEAERRLKEGELAVVVATASLELGLDIGHVDLVCHLGAPRSIAQLLQRVGRSGHALGAVPRGILYPLTRDDLVTCAAAVRAARAGDLDEVQLFPRPLDVLAQQMVATVASVAPSGDESPGMAEEELWHLVRRAYPYRDLSRQDYEQVLEMLCEGIAGSRGRSRAYLHRDRVNGRLWGRRGARLVALTNGGAIPDTADYDVLEGPAETFVGRVNEDFAIESQAGDIFLLGNRSWRIRRVGSGKVWVEDAQGQPPSIPFWLGEAPARSRELSQAVSDLREEAAARLGDREAAIAWLVEQCALDRAGAGQILDYLAETVAVLGCVPTTRRVVAERFFDESGGMQLVLHAPFGGRINRAWGLALRKRFCLTFDFELQAAATDDGLVLSLGEQHSFPLESVFGFVRRATLKEDLTQAVLASPFFINRWRQNASRALAVARFRQGRRVPMALQRMRAEDLLAAVFPAQVACQDNHSGPIEPPDHPLVKETLDNCLQEALDMDGLARVLAEMAAGRIQTVAVETPVPSVMSHEILNANPYAFLDDAPLEERRARAVSLRRVDPALATGLGALSLEAIEEVRAQAWPQPRDANELHDFLLDVGLLPLEEGHPWQPMARALVARGRAARARGGYVAAERLGWLAALFPGSAWEPALPLREPPPSPEEALRLAVLGWMNCLGPVTAGELARRSGLEDHQVRWGLAALEAAGVVLQGRFTPGCAELEWCERSLLARIHRLTLGRLRREIEPLTAADLMRFLLRWQHVHRGTRLHGRQGLLAVVGQLQGLELPAAAWEEHVLPARLVSYNPQDLEYLCLSGAVAWGRLRPAPAEEEGSPRRRSGPARTAPIAFLLRQDLPAFVEGAPVSLEGLSPGALKVFRHLEQHGASFLADIARGTGLLDSWVEEALGELVARGLVTGDGVTGLRALLGRSAGLRSARRGLRLARRRGVRLLPVGRWSLWRPSAALPGQRLEVVAGQMLRRYGVVFREILAREGRLAPWRELVALYRLWEAQGQVRGGRFVSGFVGPQYALPEAIEALREVRRRPPTEPEVSVVAAADPLNLVGILSAGGRVSPCTSQAIVYENGVPVEVGPWRAVGRRLRPAGVSG
jgi:ATP-dependent Lhr-like helicase